MGVVRDHGALHLWEATFLVLMLVYLLENFEGKNLLFELFIFFGLDVEWNWRFGTWSNIIHNVLEKLLTLGVKVADSLVARFGNDGFLEVLKDHFLFFTYEVFHGPGFENFVLPKAHDV